MTESQLLEHLEILPNGDIKNTIRNRVIKQSIHKQTGYLVFGLMGKTWKAPNVLWVYHNGPIPDGHYVDHADRDRTNNALGNLRLATKGENQRNRRGWKRDGLPKGVYKVNNSYQGCVTLDGKRYTKTFATVSEAVEWAKEKRRELHGEFYCD